jgi:Lectin C-type domain
VLTNSAETWFEAEAEAVSMGGHLVTINDAVEQAFLVNTFLTGDFAQRPLWIGLSDQRKEGRFVWSSGTRLTFINWNVATREPNDCCTRAKHEEDYVAMNWHHAYLSSEPMGTWNDVPSDGTPRPGNNANGPYFGIIEIPNCSGF